MTRSFRSRILALVLGLVTAVLATTIVALVIKARAEVSREATLQLQSAAATAREVLKFRGNQLGSAAEVLTADFGFREAVASGDRATLLSAINNHRARIGADVVIVLDPAGAPLASTIQTLSAATQRDLAELIASDSDGELVRMYRLIDGRPYQLVLAPVLGPDPIGWAALGFALDDKVAAELARLLDIDVSFATDAAAGGLLVASSLDAARRRDLVTNAAAGATGPFAVRANGDDWLSLANPIRSANGRLTLVLQRSLSSAMRPYVQLRNWLLAVGAAILAIAIALATLLARSAARPIDELTQAAERLAAGDYTVQVPPASTAELSRLAVAFNAMGAAVADREATIQHQAMHDALTGLPTRAGITEFLDRLLIDSRRAGHPVSVCLVEIQQFQSIIGSLGHAAGDEVLGEIARRLQAAAGGGAAVARIGTDQFLIVLAVVDGAAAIRRAGDIGARLRHPFDYAGVSLQLETRIGIAVFPDDGASPAELLQRADLALFRAKESGAAVSVFVRGDDELQRHRLAILGDLRRAIAQDELELHYQPKVAVRSGRVVGCEALVRWRHPTKGWIPPADFVPVAERTGAILSLTAWVLGSACRQQRLWRDAGLALDVSVNVSPSDLADPGFAETVAHALAASGADPSALILEVTEGAAMRDLPQTLRIMEQLRVLGIRFSIDDFGTGYSSLAHLKRLPVDEIKIDRSFIQELETHATDDVIVRSTINLGHALHLKVVAEGVEIAAGWDALARLGCDLVQGYLVSRPMPAADFSSWVAARSVGPDPVSATHGVPVRLHAGGPVG